MWLLLTIRTILERITSLIQPAKAAAQGYRNSSHLFTMACIITGKLGFNPLYPQHSLKQRRAAFFKITKVQS